MERDDCIEYSLHAHHSEEEGKKKRAKIWKVTGLLTLLTAVEVALCGTIKQDSTYWPYLKIALIVMTLIKAGYIVLSFMHLGEEKKSLKYIILVPYFLFIVYLLFISITEANAVGGAWTEYGNN